MIGPLIVIPCAARKLTVPAPAGELYQGSYHRACRRTADVLTADGGTTLILSGLHGLLPLSRFIAPYEQHISDPGSVTPEQLREQASALGHTDTRTVIVLAGAAYVAAARTVWPHATAPLSGLGIGRQLRRLAQLRATPLFPLADLTGPPIPTADPR